MVFVGGARDALFVAGARGACGARGAVFVAGGERGALFVAGVRAAFGCPGAEFRARSHPCGTGAAHSGIVIKYTLAACDWLRLEVDLAERARGKL